MWASLKELEPIDLDMSRAIQSSTTNPSLAKAWAQYIGQFRGDVTSEWRTLDHWKKKLQAQRPNNTGGLKKDKLPAARRMHEGLKRKGEPKTKYPPGYRHEELDDEESSNLFLPQGKPDGPTIKQESINSFSSEETDALYDDADPPYPTSSQSSKRSKLDLSGRFSMRPSIPLRADHSRPSNAMPSSVRHGTPLQLSKMKFELDE